MTNQDGQIWQQGAGDTDRDYTSTCLEWDVILNGAGQHGVWPECLPSLENTYSSRKVTDLRRFCEDVKDGDIVVLRLGTSMVTAVGVVRGEALWLDDFGDIDGWNLQHVRRVKWLWKNIDKPKGFGIYALKYGDTTQLLKKDGAVPDN